MVSLILFEIMMSQWCCEEASGSDFVEDDVQVIARKECDQEEQRLDDVIPHFGRLRSSGY